MTRHLLYYVYPVRGNGRWQWNLAQLRRRLPLFDGLRLLAVATDERCDAGDDVLDALAGTRWDAIYSYASDPAKREMVAFPTLLETLHAATREGHCFVAHAKGVTHPVNEGVSVHRWTEIQYEACLDYWPLAEGLLRAYPAAGCFKRTGRLFGKESPADWHYSGTFYWLDVAALFARAWRDWDDTWVGMESYPGKVFRQDEGATLFHEAAGWKMNMYLRKYLDNVVEPKYADWREANARHHRPFPEAA